jgi:hypothetical protein
MSPKTLLIAAAALAAGMVATLPAMAAPGDAAAPARQTRPAPLRATIMFNLIDRNADGAIDLEELSTLQKAIFTALDADKDGKLTPEEFRKVAAGMEAGPRGPGRFGPGRFQRGPDGRGGPDGRPGFHRGPGGDNRQGQLEDPQGPGTPGGPDGQMMQQGDNQDGLPPEGMGAPRDFASLDKNGDGVVSADEFAAGAPGLSGLITR